MGDADAFSSNMYDSSRGGPELPAGLLVRLPWQNLTISETVRCVSCVPPHDFEFDTSNLFAQSCVPLLPTVSCGLFLCLSDMISSLDTRSYNSVCTQVCVFEFRCLLWLWCCCQRQLLLLNPREPGLPRAVGLCPVRLPISLRDGAIRFPRTLSMLVCSY